MIPPLEDAYKTAGHHPDPVNNVEERPFQGRVTGPE